MVTAAQLLQGKILIVDDQQANVLLLEQMLRKAGYAQVSSTREPTQVCELHLLNTYDLILLDLQMPGMDGFEVMENLKAIDPGGALPVLVITAQPEHKLKALKAGARDFVSKPFDIAEVLLRVRAQLETRLLHEETRQLYAQVLEQQKVSARLLLEVLPQSVAAFTELADGSHAEVTMLFADLLAFTKFSRGASAKVLTGVLEELSTRLEGELVSGAWLSTAGLSPAVATRTIRSAQKAVELKKAVERFNRRSTIKLQLRIGFDGQAALGAKPSKRSKR